MLLASPSPITLLLSTLVLLHKILDPLPLRRDVIYNPYHKYSKNVTDLLVNVKQYFMYALALDSHYLKAKESYQSIRKCVTSLMNTLKRIYYSNVITST